MNWTQILTLVAEACASTDLGPEGLRERRVLLELADAKFHVSEPLVREVADGDLLGFEVYEDDPASSQRTPTTRLLFLAPERVLRILIDGQQERSGGFGF
ncbi:MAG: hypothetical protein JKY65_10150 [Planctomycetes bacterium]|nr:hypothetical protein [Planctomycetota bacterium]